MKQPNSAGSRPLRSFNAVPICVVRKSSISSHDHPSGCAIRFQLPDQSPNPFLEKFQRKTQVRGLTLHNAPRTWVGATKKDQKAGLKITKRAGAMSKKTRFVFLLPDKRRRRRTTKFASVPIFPGVPNMTTPTPTVDLAIHAVRRTATAGRAIYVPLL